MHRPKFEVGQRVVITGFVKHPSLNGCEGTISAISCWNFHKPRYDLEMLGDIHGLRVLFVKDEHLQLVADP